MHQHDVSVKLTMPLETLAEESRRFEFGQLSNSDQSAMPSIIALDSALRRELICVKASKRKPIRRLVDRVAHDGIIYATRLKDQLDSELIPLSADVALTGESRGVGYLAKIKSQSQRAAAVRFAAAILWPTEVENSLRDALWQVNSKSGRNELAVSVREANAGGAGIIWPTARRHAKGLVRRDIIPWLPRGCFTEILDESTTD